MSHQQKAGYWHTSYKAEMPGVQQKYECILLVKGSQPLTNSGSSSVKMSSASPSQPTTVRWAELWLDHQLEVKTQIVD